MYLENKKNVPLPSKVKEALIGELLGDGCIRFTKKITDGQPKLNTNALYCMTLKKKDHIDYLWGNVFSSICSNIPPRPWPNPKTGKTPSQYNFNTKSLPALTDLHKKWYKWDKDLNKFIKIVPLDIKDDLTAIGLAHWIMGDGFWSQNSVFLCTDGFTIEEVDLLIETLAINFNLIASKRRRIQANGGICWRIRFSSKQENITKLINLVENYFIPSLLYKLGK